MSANNKDSGQMDPTNCDSAVMLSATSGALNIMSLPKPTSKILVRGVSGLKGAFSTVARYGNLNECDDRLKFLNWSSCAGPM